SSPFIFNASSTIVISALSLHDALPISLGDHVARHLGGALDVVGCAGGDAVVAEDQLLGHASAVQRAQLRLDGGLVERILVLLRQDRKSTRLNSSHVSISYAVFCLKKKK